MIPRPHRLAFVAGLLLLTVLLVGCGTKPTEVRVAVHNDADQPVLLWLTKDGPPVETGWMSPGTLAAETLPTGADNDLSRLPVAQIEPGASVSLPPRTGKFPRGTLPIARVFYGPSTLTEFAAVMKRSPNVDTVLLTGGDNYVIIRGIRPVSAERVPLQAFAQAVERARLSQQEPAAQ